MLLSWAQAFKLLLALFTDGKIEDCMQRGAQRADEVSATLSLPLVLLVLAGKARKILRENKHECFQNILMPYLNTNSIIRSHKYLFIKINIFCGIILICWLMVTAGMKLKDAYSLEGKLRPT